MCLQLLGIVYLVAGSANACVETWTGLAMTLSAGCNEYVADAYTCLADNCAESASRGAPVGACEHCLEPRVATRTTARAWMTRAMHLRFSAHVETLVCAEECADTPQCPAGRTLACDGETCVIDTLGDESCDEALNCLSPAGMAVTAPRSALQARQQL